MNFLSKLPKTTGSAKKRLGRGLGSGQGAKSGRGTTRHQGSRENIPLHFEGGQGKLTKKFPLLRGKGKNKSVRSRALTISLEQLNEFKENTTVNVESILEKGLIRAKNAKAQVKVLGTGKLTKKLNVALLVTKTAKKAIEKLGGKIIS